MTPKINQLKSTNARTDVPHLYQECSSSSLHLATQKTQIQQHATNYYCQKQSQAPVTHYNWRIDIFLPFQDYIRCIPRPSHIPIPTIQLLKPHSTQSKQNKDSTCIYKVNHHTFQYLRMKSASRTVISTNQRSYKLQTILEHQATKLPQNSQLYLHRSQLKPSHTPSRLEKHLFFQCHLHQPDKQLLHDYHYYNRQNHYQQHISRPFRATNYNK